MLMMPVLCWVTWPELVKRKAADAHGAGALLGHVAWTCETKSR